MSVSLVVFRLELDESYPLLPHLHYTAPKLQSVMSTENDKPEEKDGGRDAELVKSQCSDDIKTHRGTRKLHDITVETFQVTADNSKEEDGTTSPEVNSKESSPVSTEKDTSKPGNESKTEMPCFSGNPFVEVTKGLLHLYKENNMTSLEDEVCRSEMICILAVPTSMTSHDLLQFTAPVSPDIEHMRIVRDATPNQYMVLIKFRSQEAADLFYKNFDGTRFNSIEPEVCHLVYVAKVETMKELQAGSFPVSGHTELPTCPVCLERMDESVDGILTILCNHSFHGSCLSKWGDTSCPVCRYCQTPEPTADNQCFECHCQDSLWICLICGYVGCGRYLEGHAFKHFLATQHTYSMQLNNNRVWDYAGDNYVHRLIQNKSDGKLVELNESSRNQFDSDEKMDSVQLEYTYLLTNQLESQRHYFEDKMMAVEKEARREVSLFRFLYKTFWESEPLRFRGRSGMEELKERTKHAVEKSTKLDQKLSVIIKEKQSLEKKVSQMNGKLSKTVLDLKDEKELNKSLRQNRQVWNSKVKELEKEIKLLDETHEKELSDLKEQLRDLMFYLEAQTTIAKETDDKTRQEIQDGQIVVGQPSTSKTSKHRTNSKSSK